MNGSPTGKLIGLYLVGVIAIVAFQLPGFLLGDNCPVLVHDIFDAHVGINSMMYSNPEDARDGVWDFLLGGLPVEARAFSRPVPAFLYSKLPALQAYLADELVIRLTAFASMFSMLLAFRKSRAVFACMVSVAFAFLPFYTASGISVAGMPLVFLAGHRLLYARSNPAGVLLWLLVLGAFPFYSSLPMVGIFLVPGMGLWWLVNLYRKHQIRPWFVLGLGLFGMGYLIASRSMIFNIFSDSPIIWHRSEFTSTEYRSPLRVLSRSVRVFLFSQYHAEANPFPFIWIAVAGFVVLRWRAVRTIFGRAGEDNMESLSFDRQTAKVVLGGVIFITVSCIFYFLHYDEYFFNLKSRVKLFAMLNLSRTYFFFPLIFYVMFYHVILSLWRRSKLVRIAAVCLVVCQISANLATAMWIPYPNKPTYRQFRSANVFDKAEQMTGGDRGNFKIACLGFFSGIANLNNFKTVGGYNSLYPLEYKHRFRKIIASELAKSEELMGYFDNQGSRCYIVSSELGKNFYITKNSGVKSISDLELDWSALREIGADFLFSAVLIEGVDESDLEYIGKACGEDAAMDIYVYRLGP